MGKPTRLVTGYAVLVFRQGSRTCPLPLLQADSRSGGPDPTLSTAGFPDSTVRESRDRGRAAIRNAGLAIPVAPITVSLACRPAEGEDFASRGPGMSGSTS
jgi:hypothetical protein